jgi:hypothetical protein
MKRIFMLLQLFSGILFPVETLLAGTPASADKIKAAYIYQFTQFITWPDTTRSTEQKFSICIFGSAPIGIELEPLDQRQEEGRLFTIRYPKKISETDSCNILYISETKQRRLQKILNYLNGKPVLTVSSIPDFARHGGMIDFIVHKNKIRLETNIAVARHSKLNISAKLLEVCLRVFGIDVERNEG